MDLCLVKKKVLNHQKLLKLEEKIIRDNVIQLKAAKYVEKFGKDDESNYGLFFTKAGRSELNKIASGLLKKIKSDN